MADQNQQLLEEDETPQLEPGEETQVLESGSTSTTDNNSAYEVLVGTDSVSAQVEDAAQFGEELIALRHLVQRYAQQMDQLKGQVKEYRDSLRNIFDNDAELQTLEEQAKTVKSDLNSKKQRIKESPESVQLQVKIKELQEEQKEIADTLNNHLIRYYQMTGSNVIEDDEGNEREIKINARLSSKRPTD